MTSVFRLPLTFAAIPMEVLGNIPLASALDVQQVHHRHHEHPNQVHEVPIEGPDLDIVPLIAPSSVAERDHAQRDYAADHVRQVQASNREEGGAEHGRSPGVLKEANALADQAQPFAKV